MDVRLWLPLLFVCAVDGLAGAERATVKAGGARVYTHARVVPDEVVRELKEGEEVVIDFAMASAAGDWCAVSDREGRQSLGYIRCDELQRVEVKREFSLPLKEEPVAAAAPPAAKPVAPRNRRSSAEFGDDYSQPLRDWANRFGFSPAQRAKVKELEYSLGVVACRIQHEDHYRAFATEYEGRNPRRTPQQEQRAREMVEDLNRFLQPCLMKILAVLEQFPSLLTDGQKANTQLYNALKKEIATSRKVLTTP